jgi:cytochrome b involved in lipid metabolism
MEVNKHSFNTLLIEGVYDHSNGAHNLLSTMRVGVIRGGMEVEAWKSQQQCNGAV